MFDVGRAVVEEMKSQDKRTVTVELLLQSLEGTKKFNFLTGTFPYSCQAWTSTTVW